MAHLFNRNVLLGVSGGIAAYKSAELIRQLQERGASVRVIMTRGAQEFITPLTLQALSGNPVYTELLDERAELGMGHIELARWADLLLIAPATADLIARLSAGGADDLIVDDLTPSGLAGITLDLGLDTTDLVLGRRSRRRRIDDGNGHGNASTKIQDLLSGRSFEWVFD